MRKRLSGNSFTWKNWDIAQLNYIKIKIMTIFERC